jgi:hypothetical protein
MKITLKKYGGILNTARYVVISSAYYVAYKNSFLKYGGVLWVFLHTPWSSGFNGPPAHYSVKSKVCCIVALGGFAASGLEA